MPAARPHGNVPVKALKWTIERASDEFKLAPNTLRKFLRQGGVEADRAGCFSTQQICGCIYGDLRAERLRKERELTRKYRLENSIVEASVLDRAWMRARTAPCCTRSPGLLMRSMPTS